MFTSKRRSITSPVFQIFLLLVGALLVVAVIGSLNVKQVAAGKPATATPTTGGPTATTPPSSWVLTWSDEFNDTTIDTSKWGYELGYVRNSEAQYYTNRPENSYEDGSGVLTIKAIRENYQGYAYTSASLNTKGKAWWTYGKFEIRARIPTDLGAWPAWWWLGTNIDQVGWPASGEIDMMEFYRSMSLYNVMDSGQHWFGFNEAFTDSTNYHIWTMEWISASNIKLYRDGVLKLSYNGGDAAFARPGYMLANLAVGGSQGGDPSGTTFPQYYYIDYIRVYCNGACAPTATPLPTSTPVPVGVAMHSQDIYTTDVNGTPQGTFNKPGDIYWRVQVKDGLGNPVSGAVVTCQVYQPMGALWVTKSSTTDANGWATTYTQSLTRNSQSGKYTINVTNITKSGMVYDPSANVKASTTFNVP